MAHETLKRELGLAGAVVTGLGSILGTGAFVAIGLASGEWGDAVLVAVPVAGLVAVFNGLSSAFLAGTFPVAGGTYEYGYRALNPWLGFGAGWLFLLAKSASAATAALGIGLYLGYETIWAPVAATGVVTVVILSGLRRTAWLNAVLVVTTVVGILWLSLDGTAGAPGWSGMTSSTTRWLPAAAFLFVAYTGYGRIATLGEEVKDPRRTIPLAVVVTVLIAAGLYLAIAVGQRIEGGPFWGRDFDLSVVASPVVVVAAVTAMLGVLLNLILGLSRVWLAMGRRGDMPEALARLDPRREPRNAILLAATAVAAVTLVGDLGLAWSFSAMTVLLYYGVTNLAALALDRRRITSWVGLLSCLALSFFVTPAVWATGFVLIVAGLVWKVAYTRT